MRAAPCSDSSTADRSRASTISAMADRSNARQRSLRGASLRGRFVACHAPSIPRGLAPAGPSSRPMSGRLERSVRHVKAGSRGRCELPVGDVQRSGWRSSLPMRRSSSRTWNAASITRVPLFPGAVAKNGVQLFVRHALAVRPVAGHGVDRIGDGHDPGQQRRFFALQAGRVAGSVPGFVVMADDGHHFIELLDAIENAAAEIGMRFDVLEFGWREWRPVCAARCRRCRSCRCRAAGRTGKSCSGLRELQPSWRARHTERRATRSL